MTAIKTHNGFPEYNAPPPPQKKNKERESIEVSCDISLKPVLTEKEACVFLGFSRKYMYDLRSSGRIGFYKMRGKERSKPVIRYRREQLLDFMRSEFEEEKPVKLKY
ncbi:MAG: helix-turn-helix domain-containing protein [Tannerella sp.]|jgi:excisionase family DNA binding protein|nr:helix-turn-helix domain-containing protein [Tannerella sp.]